MKDYNRLEELKRSIEDGSVTKDGIVFVSDETFVPMQYIRAIATIYKVDVVRVESVDELKPGVGLFGSQSPSEARVVICNEFSGGILNELSYVVCHKCDGDCVEVPKLEKWQIVDYLVSNSSQKISADKLKKLAEVCGDIYSVDNEMSKYIIFQDSAQKGIFDRLLLDNQFPEDKSKTIFDFSNAILSGNKDAVKSMLNKVDALKIEPVVLSSVLYKQLRNMILVGFNKNPTEQNTGLSSKQIYATRKSLDGKTASDVIKKFDIVCDVDVKLKSGLLKNNRVIDYLVVRLL